MSRHIKNPIEQPLACVIWMHGLGANAQDMMGLERSLVVNYPIRHIFLDAPVRPVTLNNHLPMQAWYDILGVKLADREDSKGISDSAQFILSVVEEQLQSGLKAKQIFLAGFSQGAAMALYTALDSTVDFGGVIALSGYLPLSQRFANSKTLNTPIFMGVGQFDPIVLPEWSIQAKIKLEQLGLKEMTYRSYPMAHEVCYQEINDIAAWLNQQISTLS